ncbi:MAG: ubiquinone biosynthesis accessory factor UbiJ [Methylohalobius sp. ZOD2]
MLAETAFSEAFTAALKRFLALDPNHVRLLRPVAGKIFVVELLPWRRRIVLSPTLGSVLVLADGDAPADVILRGTPLAFARMALSRQPQHELFGSDIEVEGDMDAARRLQNLVQRLDLDWEAWLAELAGEQVAQRMAAPIRSVADWHRHAWRTFQWNLTEFLQEETHALPAPLEAENQYREIARLRDDTERLAARVRRLVRKHPSTHSSPRRGEG